MLKDLPLLLVQALELLGLSKKYIKVGTVISIGYNVVFFLLFGRHFL